MATWIVHLRLAENLLGLIDGLDAASFAMGSVAPDSGIPDENWEHFDPPAEILHFWPGDGVGLRCADLEFYRRHLAPLDGRGDDAARFSFLLGYYLHLLTDNLWGREIDRPTMDRFAAEPGDDRRALVRQVKHDWYGLDHLYVRQHPDCLYWRVFLGCRYEGGYLDFLPAEAVQQRIDGIKDWYQERDAEMDKWLDEMPGVYLTGEQMDRFVGLATTRLYESFAYLVGKGRDVPEGLSFLELEV